MMLRKRPCSICRRWFQPDARTARHQRACRSGECQTERRRRTQENWRRRNPDYFKGHRIEERGRREPRPEPLRMPAPLSGLPWDLAQDVFGVEGADFIAVTSALLLRTAKDVITAYPIDSTAVPLPLPPSAAQDLIAPAPP